MALTEQEHGFEVKILVFFFLCALCDLLPSRFPFATRCYSGQKAELREMTSNLMTCKAQLPLRLAILSNLFDAYISIRATLESVRYLACTCNISDVFLLY